MSFFLLNFGESSSCHNTFAEELLTGETLCSKLKFPVLNLLLNADESLWCKKKCCI